MKGIVKVVAEGFADATPEEQADYIVVQLYYLARRGGRIARHLEEIDGELVGQVAAQEPETQAAFLAALDRLARRGGAFTERAEDVRQALLAGGRRPSQAERAAFLIAVERIVDAAFTRCE